MRLGKESNTILRLGVPMMLGQLGVILVGFIDNIMVGQYGTPELATSSFVNGWMNLAFVVLSDFSYGLTPLVSGAYATGSGRLFSLLRGGLLANLLVALLLSVVMGVCLIHIEWFRQPAELLPLIRSYYFIQLLSLIPIALFNAYKQFVDAVGETKVGMWAVVASNLFNVLFNYLLIFGKWGFPELGLVGAGLATLGSRFVALFILVVAVHYSRKFRGIFTQEVGVAVSWQEVKKIFRIGTPTSIQMGLEAGAFSVAVIMVGWLGSTELAAHQVVNTLGTLGFMMFYGISGAVSILVARHKELGEYERISSVVKSGLRIQVVMVAVVVVLFISLRHHISYLFGGDEAVAKVVAVLVFPLATYQVVDMLQILFSSVLRGLQDVLFTAVAALFCYTVVTIGSAYFFAFVLGKGVVGIWYGFPAGFTTLALLLIMRYRYLMRHYYSSTSTAKV